MKKFTLSESKIHDLRRKVKSLEFCGLSRGNGFVKYKSTYRKKMCAYKHSSGVVVKQFQCILAEDTPQHLRIPTIKLGDGWVAQPVAKKVRLREAVAAIEKRAVVCKKRGIYPDIHTGNVGWWDDKPWLFDW